MKYNRNVYHALAMISQFGINMLVPIFICSFIGIFLDRRLDTSFFMVLFFFVGALAGFRNVYLFARKIYHEDNRDGAKGRKTASDKGEGKDRTGRGED